MRVTSRVPSLTCPHLLSSFYPVLAGTSLERGRSRLGRERGVDDALRVAVILHSVGVVDPALASPSASTNVTSFSMPPARIRPAWRRWVPRNQSDVRPFTERNRDRRRPCPPRSSSGFPASRRIGATRSPARPQPRSSRARRPSTRSSVHLLSDPRSVQDKRMSVSRMSSSRSAS